MMKRRTPLLGVAALACAAAVTPAISAASAHSGAPTGRPSSTDNLIPLRAMPQATAQFLRSSDGDLSVKLSVTGVTPGSEHSVDIQRGACPASFRPGADLAQPATVQANAGGQISQTVDLGSVGTVAHGPLALTLRQGVTGDSMNGSASSLAVQGLACTQVPGRGAFEGLRGHIAGARRHLLSVARSELRPVSESGASLSGWASYSYNANDPQSKTGQSVTVTIKASGFVPGTVHAAHVHSGTCTNQGGVLVMLPDLTANAKGQISATDTVPVTDQPQGPLYINIHEGNSNTILDANGNPTLAFRPLLCGDVSQTPSA